MANTYLLSTEPRSLCDFLAESELQHYYNAIKNELKISSVIHLKYASDEDLKQIGLSRPEIRRLRKFYDKYYPHGYLSRIRKLLQKTPDFQSGSNSGWSTASNVEHCVKGAPPSPCISANKHIIPADSIIINKQLGVGEFGIVQQGVWTNGHERIQVAIKCLCRDRMQNPIEFLKEAGIMHSIEHENIVRLYGVVLDTENLMLVTELAPLRSLLECLKDSGLKVSFLTVPTLCDFAAQICAGMMYLENKRLIHRDLAARNILVFNKDQVKISDFGLSRSLGVGKDYYQTNFNVNLKLPIAWCAPECINFLRFTNASDVFAFGVCLWEMFSYGFQPWAALTGHQILESIDEPNFQRLEQPDCCPKDYYALMIKCWQHDPLKRPRFLEIYTMLPDLKPEQVKTISNHESLKKDHLAYRQNEIITVLDKGAHASLWKGVLNNGKTGLFDPANCVTYLGNLSLPCSNNPFGSASSRTNERSSKRRLRSEMISRPQNDLKHTGHVGADGMYFGDISFLTSPAPPVNCAVPRQIVTPYKPSEDIEQTPLLHPTTPTSPDSVVQIDGSYFVDNHGAAAAAKPDSLFSQRAATERRSFFDFPNTCTQSQQDGMAPSASADVTHYRTMGKNGPMDVNGGNSSSITENRHDYHEISDDEDVLPSESGGLSLVDEMDMMFQSMSAVNEGAAAYEFERMNKQNELNEMTTKTACKLNGALSYKATKVAGLVKPLSVKDDKILNHAIEIANERSARSMSDLEPSSSTAQSPKRKFSFRFPLGYTSGQSSNSVDNHGMRSNEGSPKPNETTASSIGVGTTLDRKHFSEKLKQVTDLQFLKYNKMSTSECFEKSVALLNKTFVLVDDNEAAPMRPQSTKLQPPSSLLLETAITTAAAVPLDLKQKQNNLIDIENKLKALNLDFYEALRENDKANSQSSETLFGNQSDFIHLGPFMSISGGAMNTQFGGDGRGGKMIRHYPSLDGGGSHTPLYNNDRRAPRKGLEPGAYSPQCGSEALSAMNRSGYANLKAMPHFQLGSLYSARKGSGDGNSAFAEVNSSYGLTPQSRQRSLSFTDSNDVEAYSSLATVQALHRGIRSVNGSNNNNNNNNNINTTKNNGCHQLPLQYYNDPMHISQFTVNASGVPARKSKSFKARTLRRLSYNPMMLRDSSSSSTDSDTEVSMAHSECDIRTKTVNRRRASSSTHMQQHGKSMTLDETMTTTTTTAKDRHLLYGSNVSIQSAPHFYYDPPPSKHKPGGASFLYQVAANNEKFRSKYSSSKSPPSSSSQPHNSLYEDNCMPSNGGGGGGSTTSVFKWPNAILGSTVKQNDLIMRTQQQQNQRNNLHLEGPSSSTSTSANTVDFPSDEYSTPPVRMPPSPAP